MAKSTSWHIHFLLIITRSDLIAQMVVIHFYLKAQYYHNHHHNGFIHYRTHSIVDKGVCLKSVSEWNHQEVTGSILITGTLQGMFTITWHLYPVMVNGISPIYPRGLDKWLNLRFCVDSWVWHEIPDEGQKTYWPLKHCTYSNKGENNSLNILNDKDPLFVCYYNSAKKAHCSKIFIITITLKYSNIVSRKKKVVEGRYSKLAGNVQGCKKEMLFKRPVQLGLVITNIEFVLE